MSDRIPDPIDPVKDDPVSDRIPDPVDPVKDEIETIINRIKNVVKNPFDNTVVNLISEWERNPNDRKKIDDLQTKISETIKNRKKAVRDITKQLNDTIDQKTADKLQNRLDEIERETNDVTNSIIDRTRNQLAKAEAQPQKNWPLINSLKSTISDHEAEKDRVRQFESKRNSLRNRISKSKGTQESANALRKRLAHLQRQNSYVSQQNAIRTDLAQRAQNRMRNGLTAPKTQRSIARVTNNIRNASQPQRVFPVTQDLTTERDQIDQRISQANKKAKAGAIGPKALKTMLNSLNKRREVVTQRIAAQGISQADVDQAVDVKISGLKNDITDAIKKPPQR